MLHWQNRSSRSLFSGLFCWIFQLTEFKWSSAKLLCFSRLVSFQTTIQSTQSNSFKYMCIYHCTVVCGTAMSMLKKLFLPKIRWRSVQQWEKHTFRSPGSGQAEHCVLSGDLWVCMAKSVSSYKFLTAPLFHALDYWEVGSNLLNHRYTDLHFICH